MLVIFAACTFAITQNSMAAPQGFVDISLTAQPKKWVINGILSSVNGYGNAHFGMNSEQVLQVIGSDYPQALPSLKSDTHLSQQTPTMTIVVNELSPGPGPATITYVFGASSHKLIAVNVYWVVTGVAIPEQQQQLIEAASTVTAGLLGYRWPLLAVSRGIVPVPGVLLVFSGKDFAGGGAEVRLNGVGVDIEKPNTAAHSPEAREHRLAPPGPAQLHLSFVANIEHPDVY
ncbi:hypothetical protein os1_24610 [Comamonadaceae bacterium OS-1]|nr:hypothetical protein os1_24610 [Comamonadaceae bacterium OS-1]